MATRRGRCPLRLPVFGPDLGSGEFAASGVRGDLRFVSTSDSVGLYSIRAGIRTRRVNHGAIIDIDDSSRTYRIAKGEPRDGTDKNDLKFGPPLPFSAPPSSSGTITVTASLTPAAMAGRDAYLRFAYDGSYQTRPMKWLQFWNFQHRLSNWLVEDTRPIFYKISGETKAAYAKLVSAADVLRARGGCYIDRSERFIFGTESFKGNAGASKLMDRDAMDVGSRIALHLHLNFQPVCFNYSNGVTYLLPDEIVIAGADGQTLVVPYEDLSLTVVEGTQMGVAVPSWCQPVGYTWQFMNKDGGPDRRYSQNAQIPHYRVWELDFSFPGGRLDTAFADFDGMSRFKNALEQLIQLSKKRSTR